MAGVAEASGAMDVDAAASSVAAAIVSAEGAGPEQSTGAIVATGSEGDAKMADTDDDDDPVVQECDIFLNRMHDPPDFVGDMYVLQYPLRPKYRRYGDQGQLDRVDLKEKARRLKFVYKLGQDQNYDADNAPSGNAGKRQVLTSTAVTNPSCSYAIGVLHQGRMTLTPVRAVNQMRPDFEDFEKAKAQQYLRGSREAKANSSEGSAAEDDAGQAGHEQQPVRVEFQPTARGKKGETQAAPPKEEVEVDEPWVRMDYYSHDTKEALDIFQEHLVWQAKAAAEAEGGQYELDNPKMQKVQLQGDKEVLLSTLCGQQVPATVAQRKRESQDGCNVFVLSRMPVERQVETLMRSCVVAGFSEHIRPRLPPVTLRSHPDPKLIELLIKCAVLVGGNWVLKSELAGYEGMEAMARDLLLHLLDRSMPNPGHLNHKQFEQWKVVFQKEISPQVLEELAQPITERAKNGNMYLKRRHDADFIKSFPRVLQSFTQWWPQHVSKIMRVMKNPGQAQRPQNPHLSQAHRQKSLLIGQVREALATKAMGIEELKRTIQKKNPTTPIHEEDLDKVLSSSELEVAKIGDLWACARTGIETNDKFRAVVFSLFQRTTSVSQIDILDAYQAQHGEPCKLSLSTMRLITREIADKNGEDWVLKRGGSDRHL